MKLLSTLSLALIFFSCNAATQQNAEGDSTGTAHVQNIKQDQAITMMNDSNVVVIDVRTPGEVNRGYIDGADLFIDYNGGNFDAEIAKLDKNKKYVVYCHSGARSARASQQMIDAGFTQVSNLLGGISSWSGPKK